jgi:hypothetical protein
MQRQAEKRVRGFLRDMIRLTQNQRWYQTEWLFAAVMVCSAGQFAADAETPGSLKTRNVVLIVSDGLRWQEIFSGADPQLLDKEHGGISNTNAFLRQFGQATAEQRRAALFPFFWSTIAKKGQLLGNQAKGSVMKVSNGLNFSYPGYNEMLSGLADPRINSNDKTPNPNVTAFEWLNAKPAYHGAVAAFGTWDVFPAIFNRERSGLAVFACFEPVHRKAPSQAQIVLDELVQDTTPLGHDIIFDSFHYQAALEYLHTDFPKVLFVGFGETDEWAHAGRYDNLLLSAHAVDHYVANLWDAMQQIPQYRRQTTFLITADHGRGSGLKEWRDHGAKTAGSEGLWLAAIGPDTPALGERANTGPLVQTQIAATIAALLGEDFHAAIPSTGAPILDLLPAIGK